MTRGKLALTVFILVLGSLLHIAKTEYRVELVQVLLRHGERTPREKELWPKDTHDLSSYEPWGLGQMTNQGKMREYRIGQMLRERYDEFLGDIYHPRDVYAISSDIDRTKMSLQLVLAGLYHPSPTQLWNESLPWMPIPIHYMPEKIDILLKPDFSPVYTAALEAAKESEGTLKKISIYKDLFNYLTEKTGLNVTRTNQVYEIYNAMVAQRSMDLGTPEWCTDEVYKKMQEVVDLEYEIRSSTPALRRLNGGTIVKKFIDNIKRHVGNDRKRKIYLYSGHEVNIAAYVRAHNLTEPVLPPYGCAIILEKLGNESGKHFVRMLQWTGITEELIPYKLDDDEICPLDKYVKMVEGVIPSEEECNHMWDYVSKEDFQNLYDEKLNFD